MKLSILIPTVEGREESFDRLLKELMRQINSKINSGWRNDLVEILSDKDDKEVSIGAKRQRLIEAATGDYVVFVDDDDMVAPDYIEQIINHLGCDCIGFLIECSFDGVNKCTAKASFKYKDWGDNKDGFRYVRSTYHKTPVRREIALKVGFKDMRFGEDYDYSMRLVPHLKSEGFIDKVMYYYQYSSKEPHEIKYGIDKDKKNGVSR